MYSRRELEDIVAYAAEHDWWIVSDEIYRAISYDGEATSLLSVAEVGWTVSSSWTAWQKSFAMTGWRIGWSDRAAQSLARTMAALQSHTTSNAATLSQHAALAALSNPVAADAAVASMVQEFKRRRDAAVRLLRDASVEVLEPQGAFYLYIRVGASSASDPEPGTTFARRLLEEDDVAVVPGAAFGTPEWIRVSYAAPAEQVMEGVRRIIAARISSGVPSVATQWTPHARF